MDTTVQEKNIAYPTDIRLYHKGIQLLNKRARALGLRPKQSFLQIAKKRVLNYSIYKKRKQDDLAMGCLGSVKDMLGRLSRDLRGKFNATGGGVDPKMIDCLSKADRVYKQKKTLKTSSSVFMRLRYLQ